MRNNCFFFFHYYMIIQFFCNFATYLSITKVMKNVFIQLVHDKRYHLFLDSDELKYGVFDHKGNNG